MGGSRVLDHIASTDCSIDCTHHIDTSGRVQQHYGRSVIRYVNVIVHLVSDCISYSPMDSVVVEVHLVIVLIAAVK